MITWDVSRVGEELPSTLADFGGAELLSRHPLLRPYSASAGRGAVVDLSWNPAHEGVLGAVGGDIGCTLHLWQTTQNARAGAPRGAGATASTVSLVTDDDLE